MQALTGYHAMVCLFCL